MLYSVDVAVNVCNCRNDHEIIQLFLSRGHVIDHPHPIYCKCADCELKQNTDSLKRSLSRLNTYKALSSPAFMALSSLDPITTTFELRQEMMQVAQVEKEFKVSQGQDLLRVLCALFMWLWSADCIIHDITLCKEEKTNVNVPLYASSTSDEPNRRN